MKFEADSVAVHNTDPSGTLIIVTADHGHTMTIGRYPELGNPIPALVKQTGGEEPVLDRRDLPYTTLSHANGAGFRASPERIDQDEAMSPNFQQPTTAAPFVETYSGENVPVYATGPGAARVRGVMEQNKIFHVMQMALFGDEQMDH